jgi:hypothetical protein
VAVAVGGRDPRSPCCPIRSPSGAPSPTISCSSPGRCPRYHCAIRRQGADCSWTSAAARQTFLNGQPIQESVLARGDRIGVADSGVHRLHRRRGRGDPSGARATGGADHAVHPGGASPGDSIFLQSEDGAGGLRPTGAPPAPWKRSLRIASEVNALRSPDALARRLVELTLSHPRSAGPCSWPRGRGDLRSVVTPDQRGDGRLPSHQRDDRPSRPPDRQRRPEQQRAGRDGLPRAPSIVDSRVRALLCTALRATESSGGPLPRFGRSRHHFDELDLQLLMAIGAIASAALENARHIEWLENETRRLNVDLGMGAGLVGEGARIREVGRFVAKVAPIPPSWSAARPGPGRRSWPGPSTPAASVRPGLSWRSTARPWQSTLPESELFGARKGPSLARSSRNGGGSRRRRAGPCSWTRSERSPRRSRPSSCGSSRSASTKESGPPGPSRPTCG